MISWHRYTLDEAYRQGVDDCFSDLPEEKQKAMGSLKKLALRIVELRAMSTEDALQAVNDDAFELELEKIKRFSGKNK